MIAASEYDAAVIGAGVFGAWTAWRLRQAGKSVLLLDAWGPAHSRASSGGESRIVRMGYGADEIYTRMAMRSLALWQDLFSRTGQRLFHRTGVLWIGRENDSHSAATHAVLERAGVPIEILSASEMARRYPQMQFGGLESYGIYEPESGVLMARRAVAALVEDARALGVDYRVEAIARPVGGLVTTLSGEAIHARNYVFACGPWLPALFPELLGKRLQPTRQEAFFFAPPAGDRSFAAPNLPVWLDFSDPRGPYGIPDLEGRGFKLAFDRHGEAFDPDSGSRLVSAEGAAEARCYLATRVPALRDAPLAESRVCQYENTSSGDFLIDRHPQFANMWLAGGGSGHGFKHGPAVGEYVCGILGGGVAEPRFSLAGKQETQRRAVY